MSGEGSESNRHEESQEHRSGCAGEESQERTELEGEHSTTGTVAGDRICQRRPLTSSSLLRYKVYEPILVVGPEKLANIDIRLRVKGGGHVSQLYALRQAIAKGVVACVKSMPSRGPLLNF
jgi:hypothetical protein